MGNLLPAPALSRAVGGTVILYKGEAALYSQQLFPPSLSTLFTSLKGLDGTLEFSSGNIHNIPHLNVGRKDNEVH